MLKKFEVGKYYVFNLELEELQRLTGEVHPWGDRKPRKCIKVAKLKNFLAEFEGIDGGGWDYVNYSKYFTKQTKINKFFEVIL